MSTPPARPAPLGFKIVLAAIALLFAFMLCEIGARIIFPAPPDPTRQPQLGYVYDPEIRYVYGPGDKGWIDDGFVTINSQGYRGREVQVPKPPGRFRIVTIGDSLTMGWGVNDEETFTARLDQLVHQASPPLNVDVANLGVGGYNTRQEVTFLERNLSRLQPDLVLVGFYTNDVPDSLDDEKSRSAAGTRIVAANPQAGQILHMATTDTSWWANMARRSRAAYTVVRAAKRYANRGEWGSSRFSMEIDLLEGRDSPELDQAWAAVEKYMLKLRDLADASHFAVGIVALPCREQVMGQFTQARYQSRIAEMAGRLGFFVVDPLPAMAAVESDKDELYIPYDRNHPSASGHAIIGQSIFSHLQGHGMLAGAARLAEHSTPAAPK